MRIQYSLIHLATLNLAHFSQVYKINAIGGQSFPYGDMTLNVNTFLDTTYFSNIAEHHLSAPDRPLRNDANFRISNGHFWHVAIADTNNISINSRVEYSLKYESDLMQTSEDSIQLFYRPNDKIEWSVYLFGRKIPGSLTDKRGAVIFASYYRVIMHLAIQIPHWQQIKQYLIQLA